MKELILTVHLTHILSNWPERFLHFHHHRYFHRIDHVLRPICVVFSLYSTLSRQSVFSKTCTCNQERVINTNDLHLNVCSAYVCNASVRISPNLAVLHSPKSSGFNWKRCRISTSLSIAKLKSSKTLPNAIRFGRTLLLWFVDMIISFKDIICYIQSECSSRGRIRKPIDSHFG